MTKSAIGVCGSGAMGAGIAEVAAKAGHSVFVYDLKLDALENAAKTLKERYDARVAKGKLSAADAEAILGRIQWTQDLGAFKDCALVIEAIVEDHAAKAGLMREVETRVASETIIATNTSSLSVTALAAELGAPQRCLGLHFFNPAPIMKLVEVIPGLQTDPSALQQARTLMEAWAKVAVIARDVPGFIVNRVARPFYGEGWRAFEEGAAEARVIDRLFRDLAGFRMGPLELGDLIGHDINAGTAGNVFQAYAGNTRFRPSLMQGQLVTAGRLGRKSGQGVYDHTVKAQECFEADQAANASTDLASQTLEIAANAPRWRALTHASSVPVHENAGLPPETAKLGHVDISLSAGASARALASERGRAHCVLDWWDADRDVSVLGFSASHPEAATMASQLITALGRAPLQVADRPGAVVHRTLLQLANAAADAVRDHVADADGVDKAMIHGVNYPFGPLAWAKAEGYAQVVSALRTIADETGDPLYQPSEWLSRQAMEIST